VSAEGLLAAVYDGLRLATLLVCLGAANVLANPKRLLKALPGALAEIGVAVTVALSMAPQLVESGQRIRRARRLRASPGGRAHVLRRIVIPVVEDALERSLLLAAAMDSRGYGRVAGVPAASRRATGALVLAGLVGVCVGTYGLLDASTPWQLGLPSLAAGLFAAVAGFVVGGRRMRRSSYRPDPWRGPEWGVALSGAVAAGVLFVSAGTGADGLEPSLHPLRWPELPLVPTLGLLVGALPAWLAPPVAVPAWRDAGGAPAEAVAIS
jgi:energy-coupling factor transport system permease protein